MGYDMNAIKFGIEIECYVNQNAFAAVGGTRSGYHSQTPQAVFNGWRAESDGSLHNPPSAQYIGVEFVSPMLAGPSGLAEVRRMVEQIHAMQGRVNSTCGLHINVSWPTTATPDQFKSFIASCAHFEMGLFAMTGSAQRYRNYYCAPIANTYRSLDTAANAITAAGHVATKYTAVNVSHLRNGRIEFRLFAGTLNVTKMLASIMVAVGLVQKALSRSRKVAWVAPASSAIGTCLRRRGRGAESLTRLLRYLGWGAEAASPVVRYGAIVGYTTGAAYDKTAMQPYTDKLRSLARKFDGPAVRSTSAATLAQQVMNR